MCKSSVLLYRTKQGEGAILPQLCVFQVMADGRAKLCPKSFTHEPVLTRLKRTEDYILSSLCSEETRITVRIIYAVKTLK